MRLKNSSAQFAFLLALCMALGIALSVVAVFPLQQSTPSDYGHPAPAKSQDGVTSGPVANAVAQKKPDDGKQESKWYTTFLDHTPDWFVAIFTALLTYVTYRLVRTTGDLRVATDKLWEAGERQIAIAAKAADAASKSNEVATRALIAADRPWLAISAKITAPVVFKDHRIKTAITVTVRNVGKSPAGRFSYEIEMCYGTRDARERIDFHVGSLRRRFPAPYSSFGEGYGPALFPGEAFHNRHDLSIDREAFIEGIQTDDPLFIEPATQGKGRPVIIVAAFYMIPNADKLSIPRFTTYVAEIAPTHPDQWGFNGSEIEIPTPSVRLEPTPESSEVT